VIVIDDQELLGRMLGGDEDAFTLLYRRRQGGIYRFALHMTGNAAVAEDVTQEVFMMLIECRERFEPARGSVAAFLYGIARNLVLRRIEKDRASLETEIADLACDGDLLQDLTRQETIDQVRRAVLSLPAVYREAVVLCDLQDMNYLDAAAALDCPVGTVRSRLSRGRSMLAQKLGGKARSAIGSWG
jgi:RNA polymerase sigma-70 factor (ECF subfamily)